MAKRTRSTPKRYELAIYRAGEGVKRIYYQSLRALRAKLNELLATLPSCDRIICRRRTDGFEFGHRRGRLSPC